MQTLNVHHKPPAKQRLSTGTPLYRNHDEHWRQVRHYSNSAKISPNLSSHNDVDINCEEGQLG